MTRKTLVSGLLAAALLSLALPVVTASPASAATRQITIDCTDRPTGNSGTELVVSPGDEIIMSGPGCDYSFTSEEFYFLYDVYDQSNSGGTGNGPGPYRWVISGTAAPGTYGSPSNQILGVDNDIPASCNADFCGEYFFLTIVDPRTKDLTVWQQSVGRAGQAAACGEGYTPSWSQWPNGGTGGWVCNKTIYAYYPDEPVA